MDVTRDGGNLGPGEQHEQRRGRGRGEVTGNGVRSSILQA
jgi:hypothetical protein